MRFKAIILALNLSALAAASHAQLLTPAKPAVGTPAAPAASAIPAAAAAQAPAAAAPAQSGSLAPGVVSLSDVAKQSGAEPARATAAAQPTPVPAITVADGTGQPIELAREKMRPAPGSALAATLTPLRLVRMSSVGGEDSAILWVKGRHRKVTSGARVLQYTVGEIKEDGVCLYPAKGKVKDKCRTVLTFQGM